LQERVGGVELDQVAVVEDDEPVKVDDGGESVSDRDLEADGEGTCQHDGRGLKDEERGPTTQLALNSSLIVCWMSVSVSKSTLAVASSI
jgi:hypothetical protein